MTGTWRLSSCRTRSADPSGSNAKPFVYLAETIASAVATAWQSQMGPNKRL